MGKDESGALDTHLPVSGSTGTSAMGQNPNLTKTPACRLSRGADMSSDPVAEKSGGPSRAQSEWSNFGVLTKPDIRKGVVRASSPTIPWM